MQDYSISKFYTYDGPSYYLDRGAVVFNLAVDPEAAAAESLRAQVHSALPDLELPALAGELFRTVLMHVQKMDINLLLNRSALSRDGDQTVIAVEYLDARITRDAAHLVSEWFQTINSNEEFDFEQRFLKLQADFDATLFGGPTLYSLIEACLKRDIPVLYLPEENQFQWGYGRKQIRGRSTTFHVDGIKDTEFTTFKDMCKEFLLLRGLPTPVGRNCFTAEEAIAEAEELGFPVVVKPVAGHKGQGVVTNIETDEGVRLAFDKIIAAAQEEGTSFDGAIVEQQVYGTDHRLLSVAGKFAAAIQRVPAYVDGDGEKTIAELIAIENDTVARLDNARSPLCKIKIDDDLTEYLAIQNKTLETVPAAGERVELRRVANISQGGVSINVTDKVHPDNVRMVENIAKFFTVTCLGIDALAKDISKSWKDGDFGIIEINAGPGVFMHLAPAIGESIDVPGEIVRAHFPRPKAERIPIITGNRLSTALCDSLSAKLEAIRPGIEVGSITEDGIRFNAQHFCTCPDHDDAVRITLRNPQLDFAIISHSRDDILDYGMVHEGADVVILESAGEFEEVLARDLLPNGVLIRVGDGKVSVSRAGGTEERTLGEGETAEAVILSTLEPMLEDLVTKYD